jgi:hypothetical protein
MCDLVLFEPAPLGHTRISQLGGHKLNQSTFVDSLLVLELFWLLSPRSLLGMIAAEVLLAALGRSSSVGLLRVRLALRGRRGRGLVLVVALVPFVLALQVSPKSGGTIGGPALCQAKKTWIATGQRIVHLKMRWKSPWAPVNGPTTIVIAGTIFDVGGGLFLNRGAHSEAE